MRAISVHDGHVRPTFAPPVYQAWADAHMQEASGSNPIVRFAVKYIYTANGYLWQLASPADLNRIYWKVNEFGGGGGTADPAGDYYEHGMDARGNVVDSFYGYGNSATQVHTHFGYGGNSGYLATVTSSANSGTTTYQNLAYQWYAIGNLYNRTSNPTTGNVNTLHETFGYDLHNRVLTSAVTNGGGAQAAISQTYDSVGNIKTKSDVGTYTYGGTAGAHAVTSITGTVAGTYGYDADGNMTSRSGTTLIWSSDNLPTNISQDASNNSSFSYAPDKHRYKQVAKIAGATETTIYAGGLEVLTTSSGTEYRQTLTAYGRPVMLETLSNSSGTLPSEKKHYLLTDHLGSVDTVVNDADGTVQPQESFDAFGQRRDAGSWHGAMSSTDLNNARAVTHHGFTHHEQLDNLGGLVHAGGRLLDSVTGRFLSVDPVYQSPNNTQSVNPYSYVMNNPLSLVDPSGYCAVTGNDIDGSNTTICGKDQNDGETDGMMTGSHIRGEKTGATCSGTCGLDPNGTAAAQFAVQGKGQSNGTLANGAPEKQADSHPLSDNNSGEQGSVTPTQSGAIDAGGNISLITNDSGSIGSAQHLSLVPNSNLAIDGLTADDAPTNPTHEQYIAAIKVLSILYDIPTKALDALFGAESDRHQFVGVDIYQNPVTHAIGMGEILKSTAKLYGADYQKLGSDWRYNMQTSTEVYKAGYDHKWNSDAPNDRFHAIRGYDFYHDNWNLYRNNPGINGSTYERRYMNYYDQSSF